MIPRRTLAVGAALTVLLSGCGGPAPVDPTPEPTGAPSVEPTPTPTAEPLPGEVEPASGFAIDCTDVVTAAELTALFSSSVTEHNEAASFAAAYPAMPYPYYVRATGGLSCEFSNGAGYSSVTGGGGSYTGIRVQAIGDATDVWPYSSTGSGGATASPICTTLSTSYPICEFETIIGDVWVEVEVLHPRSAAAVRAAAPAIAARVADAATGPHATAADIPCPVTEAQVTTAFGAPAFPSDGGGPWSLWYAASTKAGASGSCYFFVGDGTNGVSVRTLPLGAWAFTEMAGYITAPTAPEELVVPGLAAADQGFIRCGTVAPAGPQCYVDLVLGGDWYSIDGGDGTLAGSRAKLTRLAETVVAGT